MRKFILVVCLSAAIMAGISLVFMLPAMRPTPPVSGQKAQHTRIFYFTGVCEDTNRLPCVMKDDGTWVMVFNWEPGYDAVLLPSCVEVTESPDCILPGQTEQDGYTVILSR